MPQNQPFDVPRELRQLAEENVERARQLYLQFIEGIAQTMTVGPPLPQPRSHLDSTDCARGLSNSRKRTLMPPSGWRRRRQRQRSPGIARPPDSIRPVANEVVCRSDPRVRVADDGNVGQN